MHPISAKKCILSLSAALAHIYYPKRCGQAVHCIPARRNMAMSLNHAAVTPGRALYLTISNYHCTLS